MNLHIRVYYLGLKHSCTINQLHPGSFRAVELSIGSGGRHAGVDSTCRPAEFSVDAIDPTDLAGTKLDSIDTAYRQTLSAFNTFVCGIANVCPLNRRYQVLTDNTKDSPPRSDSVQCVVQGLQGIC